MEDAGCGRLRLFIVGYPLEYTLSPQIYMEWARREGIPLDYSVERPSSPASLPLYTSGCRRDPCCLGFNVTMPYKAVILGLLDRIEAHARVIEAVNTVYKHEAGLAGTNTDWLGVLEPLEEAGSIDHDTALIVGAGGAARAAAYALRGHVSRIIYTSRTGVTAVKLAEWTRTTLHIDSQGYKATSDIYEKLLPEASLLINASPASGARKTPIPLGILGMLQKPCTVMDMVYNPPDTLLLKHALEIGCKTIDGIKMLATQAAHNIKIWLAKSPDKKLLEQIAREHARRNPASHHPEDLGSQRGGGPQTR
ncbi:MAG: hypothetical protein GSR86_06775 [Desulfurococcales archaeon]|nr:hypothetical protein [Desulfurococcales archaeon]